ncbi:MAG: hypothetical protein M3081_01260 [Gemmatimonadota bacterium]|nr:hypothetical protein [Gemmatimonadota bacterium]
MTRSTECSFLRRYAIGLVTFVLIGFAAPRARAQTLFERFGLDRLRLTSIGAEAGPVAPARTEPTIAYAIHADYGEIAPNWRIVFTTTYWGTRLTDKTVHQFEQQLEAAQGNSSDSIRIGRVQISDIALETDVRWTPVRTGAWRPFFGGGLGPHVINAENKFINGTIVETALDQIAMGFSAVAGANIVPSDRFSVGFQARYTLLSTVRFGTVRAFGSYSFSRNTTP